MRLMTWNTQWCRGIDGRVDPARIAKEARRIGDPDVLCFQEVAENFPDPRLAGSAGENQFEALAAALPGYTAVRGDAVDVPGDGGTRRRFGNMILSRMPVQQVFRHLLPAPVDPGVKGMQRVAVEAVVQAPFGPLRVLTTHLEYYSVRQRSAQVQALRAIYADGAEHAKRGDITDKSGGPFHTFLRPLSTVICGDFNLEPDDPLHARMLDRFDGDVPRLHDAWEALHPGEPHPSTFCIYMKMHPRGSELHCDFVFVSDDLRGRLVGIRIDQHTQASDHQPVMVCGGDIDDERVSGRQRGHFGRQQPASAVGIARIGRPVEQQIA